MNTLVLGHRGSSGTAPENTAAAFSKSLQQGADGVEFDVQLSKDGHLVVMHDERVDRTTNGQGLIKDLTLKELRELSAGSFFAESFRDEKILTLEETLEIVSGAQLINIELKNGPVYYPGLEEKVLEVIKAFKLQERVIISSFNHYSVYQVKELAPEIKTGILYMAGLYRPWDYARTVKADAVHPFFAAVRPEIIENCRQAGIEVNVFGVNDQQVMTDLIQAGANSIITDYPEQALALRREMV